MNRQSQIADSRNRAKGHPRSPGRGDEDRLPPHSVEAEQGLLGCLLLDGAAQPARVDGLLKVREQCQGEPVLYDLRHREILLAIYELHDAGKPWDTILVINALRARKLLDEVGGHAYLSELMDVTPSAAMLPNYLEIVWEKFLGRKAMQDAILMVQDIREHDGPTEALWGRLQRQREEFARLTERGTVTPRYLRRPQDFSEEIMAHLVGESLKDAPGLELPIPFPLKIRRQETTLVYGDNGAGKTTWLQYCLLHQAAQGEKVCIASMEMPRHVTMWILASMLIGKRHVADSDTGRKEAASAIGWLNQRFVIFDFLGITQWPEMLDTFRYAARNLGITQCLVDSIMRIGIADDDYAQQGFCAAQFGDFAMKENAHLWYVMHENKGEKGGKSRVRGSKQWSDNACNILRIEKNEKKGEALGKLYGELTSEQNAKQPEQSELERLGKEIAEKKRDYDARIVLTKQRYPCTRQNGSKAIWFDDTSSQFREHPDNPAVNWLEEWKRKERMKKEKLKGQND